ncbi:MAG: hypothetical protein NTW04_05315 [Elusimicrobia bacterium]|nr:hypothetical protein [Elusimicrobiota bacterium]
MADEILQIFIKPCVEIWRKFIDVVPDIFVALIFLLAGLFLARAVRSLFERMFRRIKLDEWTSLIGVNETLARMGLGKSPSYAISFAMYWSMLLVFIVLAANAVNLTSLGGVIERFMFFVPRLVAAVVILFGGLLFGKFMQNVVSNSATVNNLKGGETLARAVNGIVIAFTALMALEQMGIAIALITSAIQIILASLGAAFALAFGLGAKDIAAEFLRNILKKRDYYLWIRNYRAS